MRWYAITSLDIDGVPVKREVIHRENVRKVWKFIRGRIDAGSIPEDVYGYWICEALPEETWDNLFNEERIPSNHADEVEVQGFER